MLKGRLEDDRMLTGRGKYVSDWNLAGQAYGHFVRSDRAHADLVSLDATAARAHPGVLGVFTGEDIKGALKSLPCALPVKGRGGMELKTDPEGKSSFDGIPYGKLRVQVLATGFQTYGEDFEVNQPKMDVTIKLKRPQGQYSIYEDHAKDTNPTPKQDTVPSSEKKNEKPN